MEQYKISMVLKRFICIKTCDKSHNLFKVNDLSSVQYSSRKNVRFKTSIFIWDLCDYTNAYIIVKGRVNVTVTVNTDISQKDSAFKNNVPFRSCVTKINSILIDNAEDLVNV